MRLLSTLLQHPWHDSLPLAAVLSVGRECAGEAQGPPHHLLRHAKGSHANCRKVAVCGCAAGLLHPAP